MNDKEKRELIKLIVVTAVCLIIYVIFLVDIDKIPEGVLSKKEEYTINYVSPTPMVEEVPKKLWNDPPIVKEVVLATPKPQLTETKEPEMTYLGVYTLTAYEYTGNCTADGSTPIEWWTVACNDPALFHKKIFIEGYGDFYICDTGGMPSKSILDIYLGDYDACIQFGVKTANVYLYSE